MVITKVVMMTREGQGMRGEEEEGCGRVRGELSLNTTPLGFKRSTRELIRAASGTERVNKRSGLQLFLVIVEVQSRFCGAEWV